MPGSSLVCRAASQEEPLEGDRSQPEHLLLLDGFIPAVSQHAQGVS